ncbi:HEAT repeat domain-containing protein [Streptomyces niveus]|uniref:HEAT repeat domain-containing protein n=1 Tax=Streptomyces niveus TaxID=193462 RepID=UPI0036D26803
MVMRRRFSEAEVSDVAAELGWGRFAVHPADPEEGTTYQVVWRVGTKLSLNYFEDEIARNSYVVVTGEDETAVRGTAELVEARLNTWSVDSLLAEVDEAEEPIELARAVIRAGLGAPDNFDERFFVRVNSALGHADPRVREAALWSVTYSAWADFRPRLEGVCRNDDVPDLRETAAIVLEGFDEAGIEDR